MALPDVRGWVYRVVDIFPGPLKTVGRWVADRIFGTWDEIFQLLVIFRPLWAYFHDNVAWLISGLHWLAEESARSIRWLLVEAIPTWAKWARDVAVSVAATGLNLLQSWTQTALTWLRDITLAAINRVQAFVNGVLSWAVDRVREIWGTLSVIRDRVVALLSAPEALVDWIFAALWRRFWRYLDDHAEAVGAYVWARRDRYILRAVTRIEAFLARIL